MEDLDISQLGKNKVPPLQKLIDDINVVLENVVRQVNTLAYVLNVDPKVFAEVFLDREKMFGYAAKVQEELKAELQKQKDNSKELDKLFKSNEEAKEDSDTGEPDA